MSTIRIYAAGGAGINTVSGLVGILDGNDNFASLDIAYVDTSLSNIKGKRISEESCYVFSDVDGSGKKRDANYQEISTRAKEILLKHKPLDFNVVVHSTSGGSGSVIGPVLVSELLTRDIPVVILSIGNKDSRAEIENTLNTIKSYQVISQKKQKPVVMYYCENNSETPRNAVDKQIHIAVKVIAAVFSGRNEELDSADLINFLDYTKRTTYEPTLARLDFNSGTVEVESGQVIASMVTLAKKGEETSPGMAVDYQAVGFVSNEIESIIKIDLPIHMVTVLGYYVNVTQALEKEIKTLDEVRRSVVTKSLVSKCDFDNCTDDGLVL